MADAAESPNVSDGDAAAVSTIDSVDANEIVAETADALSSLAVAEKKDPDPINDNGAAPTAVVPSVQQIDVEDDEENDDNDEEDDDDDDDDDEVEAHLPRDEFLSLLPPVVLPRVTHLQTLNDTRDAILEEYRIERAALELKYAAKMEPLYEERRRVVNGEIVEDDRENQQQEQEQEGDVLVAGGEEKEAENEGAEENIKGIPQFWACAMGNIDVIAEMITEADVDCLDHLSDITCTTFPDGLGFELTFHFNTTNPFFTNITLTKRYEVPNLLTEDEPILKNVTGCTIQWKTNKCLTHKEVTRKQRKKGGPNAGQVRSITKKEKVESFFHFFDPPKMPNLMDVVDEEEADAVEEAFDHDYDIANAIRCHLIPKAVLWFTGEALTEGYDDEEEGEEEEHEGGGGTGGEGGGGVAAPLQFDFSGGNATGSSPFPPPAAGEGENPECKQN